MATSLPNTEIHVCKPGTGEQILLHTRLYMPHKATTTSTTQYAQVLDYKKFLSDVGDSLGFSQWEHSIYWWWDPPSAVPAQGGLETKPVAEKKQERQLMPANSANTWMAAIIQMEKQGNPKFVIVSKDPKEMQEEMKMEMAQ